MGQRTPTLFTIHNLAYQGVVSLASCPELGIPAHALQQEGMEFYGKMSFLKAGMAYSSHITTVSATYAQEITTPEFGCGLDGFLASKTQQGLLSGIPNGIDESWEAVHRPAPDSPRSISATGKARRSTPPTCASCLACTTPPARCSPWSRAWSTRKAWT